jgi:hypothetical protein
MDVYNDPGDSDDMDLDSHQSFHEQSLGPDTTIPSLPETQSTATTWSPTSRESSRSRAEGSGQPVNMTVASRSASQSSHDHQMVDLNDDDVRIPNERKPDTSTETFRLLYMPDPTRRCTASRAPYDLGFVLTTITNDEWQRFKHLEGSIHLKSKISHSTTGIAVWMQEWVYQINLMFPCKLIFLSQLCVMAYLGRMHHPGTDTPMFQVTVMTWETFREAMLNDDFDASIWSIIARADCVIGGVDINLSYL